MFGISRNLFLSCCVTTALGACGTTAVDVGTAQVGTYTVNVSREGDAPAAGAETRYVFKTTSGGMPTSIMVWVGGGEIEAPAKVNAVYDPADGDFDADLVFPTPIPAHPVLWFDVITNDVIATGSLSL